MADIDLEPASQPASQEVREGGKERQKGQSLSPQHRGPGITWHPVCHSAINKDTKEPSTKTRALLVDTDAVKRICMMLSVTMAAEMTQSIW